MFPEATVILIFQCEGDLLWLSDSELLIVYRLLGKPWLHRALWSMQEPGSQLARAITEANILKGLKGLSLSLSLSLCVVYVSEHACRVVVNVGCLPHLHSSPH